MNWLKFSSPITFEINLPTKGVISYFFTMQENEKTIESYMRRFKIEKNRDIAVP